MKIYKTLRTAIVGCGLIGKKRARWVQEDPRTALDSVVDLNRANADALAAEFQVKAETDWKQAVKNPDIDIVIVSTPNHLLCPIASAALKAGKHVLIEKPMGRSLAEAKIMAKASKSAGKKLKVGFNHRYHPALLEAHDIIENGEIGKIINLRAIYGHGGRMGYEKEWRGNPKLSGGGELTDQGVHLINLMEWFCGEPKQVSCFLQTAHWNIKPSEDNGFAILRFKGGVLGSFHSSWTQWKNAFAFEVFGDKGFISINGLGGSYGAETLTIGTRKAPGQVPEMSSKTFEGEDLSWKREWDDFVSSIENPKRRMMGGAEESVSVMKVLDALYRSNRSGKTIILN